MRHLLPCICLSITAFLLLPTLRAEPPKVDPPILAWDRLPDLPDALGVAGPFAGVHNDALIVAGGANFPQPVWETAKVWHTAIHVLTRSGDTFTWRDGGILPRPIAYGATVSTTDGVVCMGGNDAEQTFNDVFLLQWDAVAQRVAKTVYPALPRPCAFGAATVVDNVIYLAGGQSGLSLETAMANFWSLDLSKQSSPAEFVWKERQPWPGLPRALNITVGQHNETSHCIYVISGRRQTSSNADDVEFLRDVWEYSPARNQWRQRTAAPRCVMAGTASGLGKRSICVFGGADGSLYFQGNDLRDQHPGFPKEALVYDTTSDTWAPAGPVPRNHVTTVAVKWNDAIIIPSGEVRPRVRSSKVWRVTSP